MFIFKIFTCALYKFVTLFIECFLMELVWSPNILITYHKIFKNLFYLIGFYQLLKWVSSKKLKLVEKGVSIVLYLKVEKVASAIFMEGQIGQSH